MNESESGLGGVPAGRPSDEDTATIDSTIDALYRAISFPPGGRPRWESLRSLFLPGGRVIPPKREGDRHVAVLSVDEFVARSDELFAAYGLVETGFDERDTHRVTEQFGNAAHVFSTYESRRAPEDPEPFQRGVTAK
ncbi:MAG: hypothetical protein LC800_04005 [Acidobacteria bacterium]|nr:hypothetical protein [Acidobacteriota bacterium]